MKRLLVLLPMILCITTAFTQIQNVTPATRLITKAEYFFETDPGLGNGFPIRNFSPADTAKFTANIPLGTLTAGFHILQMRVCDTVGMWSLSEKRFFYISITTTANAANIIAAEYFFDTDPGAGNGIPTSVGTPGAVVNFAAMIPASLLPGFHFLAIRTKDADGKWGLSDTRSFYVSPPATSMPPIVAAEYFYDNDPGIGQGTALPVSPTGDIVTPTFMVPVPVGMSASNHLLAIRVKDQLGNWSLFEKDTLTVGAPSGSITCPGNVTIDPFTNDCKAVVNHIDAVGLPADDSSYTYTLTGATTGNGIGTASGQLFNAGITTVTYALISSPTVACSFTVTVKSSVTPTATISIHNTTICEGTLASFQCIYTGGGFNPTWQWKKNGIPVGTSSNLYRDSTLKNSDTITAAITSSISCANPQTVTSAPVIMTVNAIVTPSVSINASATTICPGQSVTFTAIPTHGGTHPVFEWVKNGVVVGTDSVYQTSTIANGDSIYLRMYNNSDCIIIYPAVSNVIHMGTSQAVTPSVSISTPQTTICSGTLTTFTASPSNGGNPTYQWQLNGNNIPGATGSTYQTSSLVNGEKIKVVMTSSLGCVFPSSVTSNEITMTVNNGGAASVTIDASQTTICAGQVVTFTAMTVNGGTDPAYEWTLNGSVVGSDTNVYQSSSFVNGDVVRVTMQPYGSCAGNAAVYSNSITMTVGTGVTPSVKITASAIDICAGTSVTFMAAPVNGGSNPHYQWKLNGINVGGDSAVFRSSTLANADTVKVVMTSSLSCATSSTAVSNYISMDVSPTVTPIVTIAATATTICQGTTTAFSATATNGGDTPTYEWRLNGNVTGNNSPFYQNSNLLNGDVVSVVMKSSLYCATPKSDTSNTIAMTVLPSITYYPDADGDGYGSANSESGSVQACTPPQGFVTNNLDCDDNNAGAHPGASEICGNGIDDNCNGIVDENCTARVPTFILRPYAVKEGDAGQTTLDIEVKLDTVSPAPVFVNYATADDDARQGSDYVPANGTLTIPANSLSGKVPIKIIGDLFRERNERFSLKLSNPVNALLTDSTIKIMIIDDDRGKNNVITHVTRTVIADELLLRIPTVVRRNQVWMIPQIGKYENEILIMDTQGQMVSRFVNYQNHTTINNVAAGLYFYRLRIMDGNGQVKYYTGRLLITE